MSSFDFKTIKFQDPYEEQCKDLCEAQKQILEATHLCFKARMPVSVAEKVWNAATVLQMEIERMHHKRNELMKEGVFANQYKNG